jgi:nucleotide-diphospho-sugar transferase
MHSEAGVAMSREPLIVTFADARYLPLLAIWLGNLRRFGLSRIKVYGLDGATLAWCETQGVDAAALAWNGDLRHLWVQRIRVFSALLNAGEEVIHSDTDAIWMQNPLLTGSARERHEDLIFSQGTVWPLDIHDRWGFVLCCGWFWARPVPAVRAFFEALEVDVQSTGDDQVSVNRLLTAAGAQWSRSRTGDYQLPFRNRMVQCWSQPIHATTSAAPLTVALLPQCEFQRLPEDTDRAVVKHFVTPKNCEQKLQVLRQFGLIR